MAKKNWMKQLQSLDGAVTEKRNIHATVIQSPSPSFNFMFGKGHGLPRGSSALFYGPPKSGKSLVSYMMAGQCHRDYPEAVVIKFNTEFREEGQLDEKAMAMWGIDPDRYIGLDVNEPALIYDQLKTKVAAWVEDGMDLGLVIIDSMNGVQGRRAMDQTTIMTQQIGDVAATNKEGLKSILPLQHKARFALIMTSHVTPEMDRIEQMRGNKYKAGVGVGTQHHAEYFVFIEQNSNKEGKSDISGHEFVDDAVTAGVGTKKGDVTAHKIRSTMKNSSLGPKGRMAEFTLDYERGLINVHEEVFLLGVNRNIIQRPNNSAYEYGGHKWTGQANFIAALEKDPEMQQKILADLRTQDLDGRFSNQDAVDAVVNGEVVA